MVLDTAAHPWVFEGSGAQGRQWAMEDSKPWISLAITPSPSWSPNVSSHINTVVTYLSHFLDPGLPMPLPFSKLLLTQLHPLVPELLYTALTPI